MSYVILVLAAWRMSNLVANETGPFRVFRRVRLFLLFASTRGGLCRKFGAYELAQCEYCNSVWIGAGIVVAYSLAGAAVVWLLAPLAISTAVIFLKIGRERLQAWAGCH